MRFSRRTGAASVRWLAVLVLVILALPTSLPGPHASAQVGSGGLIIDGLACPAAFPADNLNLSECRTPIQAPAAIVSDSISGYQATSQDDAAGRRIWTGLAIETVNIAVTMPDGAVAATVGCGPESGGPETYVYGTASVAPPEAYYSVLLLPDTGVRCVFYYHSLAEEPAGPDPTATETAPANGEEAVPPTPLPEGASDYITMTLYACPPGLADDSTVDLVLMECVSPAQGIPYYLETDPETWAWSDVNGQLSWERPAGVADELEVGFDTQYIRQMYLECAAYPTGSTPSDYVPWNGLEPGQADEIAYPADPGTSFDCRAYLKNAGVRLEFMTWQCTDAFDPEGDLETYRADPDICQPRADWSLRLRHQIDDEPGVQDVASITSIVDWPGGPLALAWNEPAANYPGYVHCEIGQWHQSPDYVFGDKPTSQADLTFDLAPGEMLACEWFVLPGDAEPLPAAPGDPTALPDETAVDGEATLPAGETGEIRIYTFSCPIGTTGDYQALLSACDQPGIDIGFQRERLDLVEDSGRTDSAGRVWFADVPAGSSIIREESTQATGGQTARVFCGSYEYGSGGLNGLAEYGIQNGLAVELEIRPNWITLCEWYNIPLAENGIATIEPNTDYGQVIVHKYRCDLSTVENRTFDEISAACDDPSSGSGFGFALSYGGITAGTTTDQNGLITWNQVDSGPVSIYESTNATGYRIAAVFCSTYPSGEAASAPEAIDLAQIQSGTLATELPPNSILECYWYNELDPDAHSSVVVLKYLCPPGYDIGQPPGDEARVTCRREYGLPLRLTTDSGYDQTAYTGIDGLVGWYDVPYEEVKLTEPGSESYQLGWAGCSVYYYLDGPGELESAQIEFVDIEFGLRPGYSAYCELFNYWTGPPEGYDDGYGQITIAKYVCPAEWATSPGPDDSIAITCTDLRLDVAYLVVYPNDLISPVQVQSGVTSPPVQNGIVDIQEPAPFGEYTYRVRCIEYSSDAVLIPETDVPASIVNGVASITWTIRAGTTLSCSWYNLPGPATPEYTATSPILDRPFDDTPTPTYDPAYARVNIHKYMCGEAVDPALDIAELIAACSNSASAAGFGFGLASGGTNSIQTTTPNGNPTWTEVAPGPATVTEYLEGTGYRAISVYCAHYQEGASEALFERAALLEPASAPSIAYDAQAGYVLECYWFNQPDPNGYHDPIVVKFMCPYGYIGPWGSPDRGTGECRREYGRTIYLDGPNGAQPMTTTGADGFAYASDMPYGDYRIYEVDDPNSDLAGASCWIGPANTFSDVLEAQAIADGGISVSVPPGNRLYCELYNVWTGDPAGYDQGYGQLLIHKYDCPADGNIYPGPDDDIAEVCAVERFDVPFRAFRHDGSIDPVDFPSGFVSPAISSGPLVLAEIVPDGFRVHRVFCVEVPNQGSTGPMTEATVQDVDGGAFIELNLRAGYVFICNWYNRPYLPEETPVYNPTYYPSPDDGFVPGEEYTPTYTVEAPYEYTATPTLPAEYTPTETYPADYTATATYAPEQTYTPEYTPTYDPGAPYTATPPGDGGGAPGPTYTATVPAVTRASETPEPTAILAIVSYLCPAGYDPTLADSNPGIDCTDAPGETRFALLDEDGPIDEQPAEQDDDETYVARFDGLDEGLYTLLANTDEPAESGFIGECTSSVRTFGEYAFRPYARVSAYGSVVLDLVEGEELTCAWYRIPRSDGTVSLLVMSCPGAVANPARCEPVIDSADVALVPAEDGEIVSGSTGAASSATLTAPAGPYLVEVGGVPACLVDSIAVDDAGYLVIEPGADLEAVAYRCTPD